MIAAAEGGSEARRRPIRLRLALACDLKERRRLAAIGRGRGGGGAGLGRRLTDEVGAAALALHGEVNSISARRPGWIFVDSSLEMEPGEAIRRGEAILQLVPED